MDDAVAAVLFDMDGTLIDSVDAHAHSWAETFDHFGLAADYECIRKQIGKSAELLMRAVLPPSASVDRMKKIKEYRSTLFRKQFLPWVRPFPHVRELFQLLHAKRRKIVLVFSCPADEIDNYKKIADVADLVDEEVTSDHAEHSKPAPDLFNAALSRLAPIPAEQVLAIGDTIYDAKAAMRASITAIGMLCGAHSEADLRVAGCATIYKDPADLLRSWSSCGPDTRVPSAGPHARPDLMNRDLKPGTAMASEAGPNMQPSS
jgi:phosphoglycolate phosphatase-like HAD superfamily hydrolase